MEKKGWNCSRTFVEAVESPLVNPCKVGCWCLTKAVMSHEPASSGIKAFVITGTGRRNGADGRTLRNPGPRVPCMGVTCLLLPAPPCDGCYIWWVSNESNFSPWSIDVQFHTWSNLPSELALTVRLLQKHPVRMPERNYSIPLKRRITRKCFFFFSLFSSAGPRC